ncbi:hypothetical protein GCM10010346_33770 [Streptomyces chryseus]|uniref:Uncharacterized protein n=1 Tax=Streptomyces chryseus TaxID=68186 RepID=A0ABQ3DNG9_9ACTN|nr:hypothetical protein GCM10010346_33770 [Streptomyces chryseus]
MTAVLDSQGRGPVLVVLPVLVPPALLVVPPVRVVLPVIVAGVLMPSSPSGR